MNSRKSKKLAAILEAENFRLFEPQTHWIHLKDNSSYHGEAMKTYQELLAGSGNPFPLQVTFNIIHDNFVLILDEELAFNRYRKKTMQSLVYENFNGINTGQYKRYCRLYEQNCLKVGLQDYIWNNADAEQLFGKPAEPGDFFGNGSPGWKLNAFRDYMQDIYSLQNNWNLYRISIYDNLLIEGKLQPLGKLLETGSERYHKGVFNFLKLKLKL